MTGALQRYQKLGLRESLSRTYDYPYGCNELSLMLRGAYSKVSKNLQAIMFQDTLTAFRLLPEIQTRRAIAAANLLLQAVEVALPKQKKVLAVTEFKHAVVAHKRRYKVQHYEEGSAQLPQDVLIHLFTLLDLRSLVSVGLACWSWNLAASDNKLWQLQYALFYGKSDNCSETKQPIAELVGEKGSTSLYHKEEEMETILDWREAFKRAYIGNSSCRTTSNRGYCGHCKSIVWVSNMKCANVHHGLKLENQKMKLISSQQVVEYLLEGSLSTISSSESDSDSDSDEESHSRLWAYPQHICRCRRKHCMCE